ncbi:hypothetical protein SAMN05428952_10612 [Nitrosomonas sp. Nm132]|nr:hypothetical protein SAMN05428952_10612 [Nitrosomonas sp. Nm132]
MTWAYLLILHKEMGANSLEIICSSESNSDKDKSIACFDTIVILAECDLIVNFTELLCIADFLVIYALILTQQDLIRIIYHVYLGFYIP